MYEDSRLLHIFDMMGFGANSTLSATIIEAPVDIQRTYSRNLHFESSQKLYPCREWRFMRRGPFADGPLRAFLGVCIILICCRCVFVV